MPACLKRCGSRQTIRRATGGRWPKVRIRRNARTVRSADSRSTRGRIRRDWSRHSDLNRGPAVYETAALPLSYVGAEASIGAAHRHRLFAPSGRSALTTPRPVGRRRRLKTSRTRPGAGSLLDPHRDSGFLQPDKARAGHAIHALSRAGRGQRSADATITSRTDNAPRQRAARGSPATRRPVR